jgi:hypothetical protein
MSKLSLLQKLKIQINDVIEKGKEIGNDTKLRLLKEKEYYDNSKDLQNPSRHSSS